MLKKILILVLVLIAGVLVYASQQPDDFSYSRSAVINARASAVFVQVDDLRNWNEWSPWAKLDPNAKSSFEGPAAGLGAKMSWDGNMEVGKGQHEDNRKQAL